MELVEHLRKELRNTFKGDIPDHVLEDIIDEYFTDSFVISQLEEMKEEDIDVIIFENVGTFLMKSGPLLFDLSLERLGIPLWNGAAWQSKQCHKMCPLGDYCGQSTKKVYTIEENEYCIGQLYAIIYHKAQCTFNAPQLTDDELYSLTIPADKPVPSGNGKISASDINKISHFMFEFGPYTMKFDYEKHKYYRKTNKYPGGNVIPFL